MNGMAAELLSLSAGGASVGTLVGFSQTRQPLVALPAHTRTSLPARSCIRLTDEHVGRGVVIVYERDCADKPIVLGLLEPLVDSQRPDAAVEQMTAHVDGTRVVLSAEVEIVLRCGDASITLTRAGKILIRGAYVSSHSSGVHRIKGATVEIN